MAKLKRKNILQDIRHGGTFNDEFVDKGITFYEENGSTNHSDKIVNHADIKFYRPEEYEDEREQSVLEVTGDVEISNDTHVGHDIDVDNDARVHNDLEVDNDTTVHGHTKLIGKANPISTTLDWDELSDNPDFTYSEETDSYDYTGSEYYILDADGNTVLLQGFVRTEEEDGSYTYTLKDINDVEYTTSNPTPDVYTLDTIESLEVVHTSTFHDDIQADRNVNIDGTLDVTDSTHLKSDTTIDGPTTINNTLNVYGTTTIKGDLHVEGTAYEEHATDVYTGADFITMREGSNTHLADGERAGIIIQDYNDDSESLGIVTGEDGILRIGDFGITKVFTDDDTTYYDNRDLEGDPVEIPEDTKLYQIGDTDPDTGLKEYYFISKDNTEAIATRGDADVMRDKHFVIWDAEGQDLITCDYDIDEFNDVENEARLNTLINEEQDDRLHVLEEKTRFALNSTFASDIVYGKWNYEHTYESKENAYEDEEYFTHLSSSEDAIEYYNAIIGKPTYFLEDDTYYRIESAEYNTIENTWNIIIAGGNDYGFDEYPETYILQEVESTFTFYKDEECTEEFEVPDGAVLYPIETDSKEYKKFAYYHTVSQGTAGIVYPDGETIVVNEETGELTNQITNEVSVEWPLTRKNENDRHITIGLEEDNEIHQYTNDQEALDDLDNLREGNIVTTTEDDMFDGLAVDRYPTRGSENLVTSGGIYEWSVGRFIDQALDADSLDAISNKAVSEALDAVDNSIDDLKQSIQDEVDRASAVENDIQNDLNDEINRALDAESDLDNNKLPYYAVDSSKWDTTPTNGSTKPVTSGGLYTAIYNLQNAINTLNNTTIPALSSRISSLETWRSSFPGTDSSPTSGSNNFVTSGGVYSALQNNVGRILTSDPGENNRVWAD